MMRQPSPPPSSVTTNEHVDRDVQNKPLFRCGADGKGYLMTLPRGWGSKIGIALKIGVAITAAATDAGELTDLPVPGCQGSESSAEWQGQVRFVRGSNRILTSCLHPSLPPYLLPPPSMYLSLPPSPRLRTPR